MIVLDTSAIIEVLKGTETGRRIIHLFDENDTAITSFTIYELMRVVKEKEIPKIEAFLTAVRILPFDALTALQSVQIQKRLAAKGRSVEITDVFIAGVCLAHNAPLVTLDKGFAAIDGLEAKIL